MRPSVFCPEDCLMEGLPGCTPGCLHSRDRVFKTPEDVEVVWTRGQTKKGQIVGRADNTLYLKVGDDISTVSATTVLIRSK